jgi:GNAT superfamily N-acetyltransferase
VTDLRWLTAPDPSVLEPLADCWYEVSAAGGAVGFPPPVVREEVQAAAAALVDGLSEDDRLLLALDGDALAGWVLLSRGTGRLVRHWATLLRLQTALSHRGQGVGALLVREAARSARDDLGLEHLHLTARGGMGLEGFYLELGFREVGRRPRALRVAPGDDRDEVLLHLPPS